VLLTLTVWECKCKFAVRFFWPKSNLNAFYFLHLFSPFAFFWWHVLFSPWLLCLLLCVGCAVVAILPEIGSQLTQFLLRLQHRCSIWQQKKVKHTEIRASEAAATCGILNYLSLTLSQSFKLVLFKPNGAFITETSGQNNEIYKTFQGNGTHKAALIFYI